MSIVVNKISETPNLTGLNFFSKKHLATHLEDLAPIREDFTVIFNSTSSILTTVTNSPSVVTSWISSVYSTVPGPTLVGLVCLWGLVEYPVDTLQLSLADRCLIFQIRESLDPNPSSLAAFLSDPNLTFVGVDINEGVRKLQKDYNIVVENVLDLRSLAVEKTGVSEMMLKGLKELAKEVMGVDVWMPEMGSIHLGQWHKSFLQLDQIGYACIGAFLSFEIGRRLHNGEFSSTSST